MDRHTRPPSRARNILKHYVEHPQTADTLEGIAGWRLLEDLVRSHVRRIDAALEWLVAQGYLNRSAVRRAAPPLYTLNVDRRADAERLVARGVRRRPRKRGRT